MFREANRGNLLINPTWETFWYKMLLKELESLDSLVEEGQDRSGRGVGV